MFWFRLFDLVDPALGSFDPAHLDTRESIIELLCDGPHLVHTAREANLLAVVYDLSDRGDNCGCSAPSFVTNRKFAPPVSSTWVRVAASRYIFSSKPFS